MIRLREWLVTYSPPRPNVLRFMFQFLRSALSNDTLSRGNCIYIILRIFLVLVSGSGEANS